MDVPIQNALDQIWKRVIDNKTVDIMTLQNQIQSRSTIESINTDTQDSNLDLSTRL